MTEGCKTLTEMKAATDRVIMRRAAEEFAKAARDERPAKTVTATVHGQGAMGVVR